MSKPVNDEVSPLADVVAEVPGHARVQAHLSWARRRRRLIRALLLAALFVFAVAILTVGVVVLRGGRTAPTNYDHTNRSLEAAFNWVHCGRFSELRQDGLRTLFNAPNTPYDIPFVTLADNVAGISEYCNGSFSPVKNEDSSLFYLFSGAMSLLPNASANTMFLELTALMMACLLVFAAAVAAVSRSLILTLATVGSTVGLYTVLSLDQFLSIRVFMWPPLLLFAGVLILTFKAGVHLHWFKAILVAFPMGVTAAFVMNMRGALILHVAAVWLVYLLFVLFSPSHAGHRTLAHRAGSVLTPTAALVAGVLVFSVALIGPLERLPAAGIVHHPFAHPLVLGLAVPPNRFAQEQGITWHDAAGLKIARTINPDVRQLSPEYESALWTYYRRLWTEHPDQMAGIYLRKGQEGSLFEVAYTRSVYIGWLTPFWVIPSGYYVIGLILLVVAFSMKDRPERWKPRNLLVATAAAIAFAEYIESVAVYTAASLYYPLLIFSVLFFGAMFWSLLERRLVPRPVDKLWRQVHHAFD